MFWAPVTLIFMLTHPLSIERVVVLLPVKETCQ